MRWAGQVGPMGRYKMDNTKFKIEKKLKDRDHWEI
jgi:hypothetical protein